jgi:uncharacterized RDD family membrane protein YckC
VAPPGDTATPAGDEPDGLTARMGRAGAATGRLALRPFLAVAHAGRDALADEADRAIDAVLAGPTPEAVGRSLVEHRVPERVLAAALQARAEGAEMPAPTLDLEQIEALVRRARDNPDLRRMLVETVHSELASDLADEIVRSAAFRQVLTSVLTSEDLRRALERQTASFGSDVVAAVRRRAERADDSIEASVRRWLRRAPRQATPGRYGGVGTRGTALVVDALLVQLVFLVGGALIALVASLFGTLRPAWLVDVLAAAGWLLVVVTYFVGFWSTVGQTPGMRMMGVGVVAGSGEAPSGGRSLVRLVGLALAIIPMFAGFLPALFDGRRRALPDYLAGTTVVYRTGSGTSEATAPGQ